MEKGKKKLGNLEGLGSKLKAFGLCVKALVFKPALIGSYLPSKTSFSLLRGRMASWQGGSLDYLGNKELQGTASAEVYS